MKFTNAAVLLARLSALTVLWAHTVLAQEFSEPRLLQACSALQLSPLSAGDLQTLAEASRVATNSPALRSRAMAAYSLALLLQLNTNAFERALTVMQSACPEALQQLKVSRSDCLTMCLECLGSGKQTTLCPTCMGAGTCKVCSGTGKAGQAPCSVCKGKGECARCLGKKRISTPCPACKGTSQILKPKESIRNNYNALLAEMVSICQENARYAEQFRVASKEADLVKRIALLRSLIAAFPHRSDLGAALSLMKQSINAQTTEESRLRAKEKREREDRDRIELQKFEEAKSTADLDKGIAALDSYLKAHPDCAAYLDFKLMEDQLIARRDRAILLRKILIGVLSLVGLLIALSVLSPLVLRKKANSLSPLPGMDKIDKSRFTDPLKLNAQASKSRVKTKTAEIDPPEL
jgi:hypothetical protein